MILNERQYKITSRTVTDLTGALAVEVHDNETPEWLHTAHVEALKSQINELTAQVREYELLRNGNKTVSINSDLQDLPLSMIRARVAHHMTQAELAAKIGVSEQQIQRYESSRYQGVSLSRLIEITTVLGIRFQESWETGQGPQEDLILVWNDLISLNWNNFPIQELLRREWIRTEDTVSSLSAIRTFIVGSFGQQLSHTFQRKKYHGSNTPDAYALLAWQARVLNTAREELDRGGVPEFIKRDDWLNQMVSLSLLEDPLPKVKHELLAHGIVLVIEEHLPGTYLDGAAMRLETGHPVVALTLRQDRLDQFWFVLFHELAHVFLHLDIFIGLDYFDEYDTCKGDSLEMEAEIYALDTLLPERSWNSCISRSLPTETSIKADADRLGIHPSIIAGRIRKEHIDVPLPPSLVGLHSVRKQSGLGKAQ